MSTTEATSVNPNLRALAEAGTSPWLDLLRRSLVQEGELARLVAEDSLRGVTANPSIFEKAILESDDYDEELATLADESLDAQAIYERLAIKDVQLACDVLRRGVGRRATAPTASSRSRWRPTSPTMPSGRSRPPATSGSASRAAT